MEMFRYQKTWDTKKVCFLYLVQYFYFFTVKQS